MNAEEIFREGVGAEEAGDFIGAAAVFRSWLDDPDPTVAAAARLHLGRVTWKQGRLDEALVLCEEARDVAVRLDDHDLRARVENAIGVLHVARGEYAQAQAAYGIAMELTADAVTRAKIALNLGVISNIRGNYEQAGRRYLESEALFRSAGDDKGVALVLHNRGMLHADRSEWDEADESFGRALSLFEEQQNKQMIANVLLNRSEVSYGRRRVHEAISRCDMALNIYGEIGDEVGRGESLRWKGHGLRLLGRLAEAEHVLLEAIRIAERTRVKLLAGEVLRELGLNRRAQGKETEAVRTLGRARAIFDELGAHREAEETAAELDPRRPPPSAGG